MDSVFEKMIEPGLDSVPVLDVMHSEWRDGVKYRVTQTIARTIYTDFDRKLSDHLAATRGKGYPGFKVLIEVVDLSGKQKTENLRPSYHDSAPHALNGAVKRAFERVGPVELVLQRGDCNPGQVLPVSHRRRIDGEFVELMDQGLGIVSHLGATQFMEIAGEFDLVTITPPGGVDSLVLRLGKGTVLVPSMRAGPTDAPFEWPISAFAERASTNVAAQNYLAGVRHAIVTRKEEAILAFRAAAEERIRGFERALAGRPLNGHWRESAIGLIARLRAGLGDRLTGLSDDARGIALDWCAQLAPAAKPGPRSVKPQPVRATG